MSSSKNPSSSAYQDDPWEQLAEDLFGLEYGKEHSALAPAPPAVEPPSPPVTASHAAPDRPREETKPEVSISPEEPPRFASEAVSAPELTFEETPVPEPEGPSEPAVREEGGPAAGAGTPATSPQDSYWDALANWNWDESEGGGKPRSEHRRSDQPRPEHGRSEQGRPGGGPPSRGGSRGRDEGRGRRGGERPPRQGTGGAPAGAPSPAQAPRQPAPPINDDFGLGLEPAVPGFSAPAEASPTERQAGESVREDVSSSSQETQQAATGPAPRRGDIRGGQRGGPRPGQEQVGAGGEGEFPRRRRRRRRRRGGRGGEGETGGGPSAATVPAADWDDSAGPEVDLPQEEIEPAAQAAGGEPPGDFTAHRPPRDSRGRRHGRRHDEERRGTPAERAAPRFDEDEDYEEPQEIVVAGGGAGEPEMEAGAEPGDDEGGEEQVVSYDDVPTWEEAISYLLHPNQVQVEPGPGGGGSSPPRGAPPADQPRQTRHIGHRKHRR